MAKEGILSKLRKKEVDGETEELRLVKELSDLRFKLLSGQLKETHKIKEIRREIAKVKTLNKESIDSQESK